MTQDKKDMIILEALKQNSRLSAQQISAITGIPTTTVHNRIKKLEKSGIIKGYTIVLDHKKLGNGLEAYVLISFDYNLIKGREYDIARRLAKHEFVEEVAIITGTSDIITRVRASNVEQLDKFVTKELANVKGVEKTQTMLVLSSF